MAETTTAREDDDPRSLKGDETREPWDVDDDDQADELGGDDGERE